MKFSIKDLNNRNIERHQNFTGFYITKSILVVVRYQTSHLKILSMILIKKQMLIRLRRNHIGLPKTKGTKQSVIVGMVSKLETCGKSIKRFSAQQSARQIQYLIFKYLTLFSLLICFLCLLQLLETFPAFSRIRGLNAERYSVSICPYSDQMRENTGKIQTKITPNSDTFHSVILSYPEYLKI